MQKRPVPQFALQEADAAGAWTREVERAVLLREQPVGSLSPWERLSFLTGQIHCTSFTGTSTLGAHPSGQLRGQGQRILTQLGKQSQLYLECRSVCRRLAPTCSTQLSPWRRAPRNTWPVPGPTQAAPGEVLGGPCEGTTP